MKDESNKITRRHFFYLMGNGSILMALGGTGIFTYQYLSPNVLFEPSKAFKAGPASGFPVDSWTFIEDRKIFVAHDKDGFFAISAVCTHLGCTVIWKEGENQFHCPCHGSFFTNNGKVKGGPAPRSLDCFAMSIAPDGELVIDTGKIVDSQARLKA